MEIRIAFGSSGILGIIKVCTDPERKKLDNARKIAQGLIRNIIEGITESEFTELLIRKSDDETKRRQIRKDAQYLFAKLPALIESLKKEHIHFLCGSLEEDSDAQMLGERGNATVMAVRNPLDYGVIDNAAIATMILHEALHREEFMGLHKEDPPLDDFIYRCSAAFQYLLEE